MTPSEADHLPLDTHGLVYMDRLSLLSESGAFLGNLS